MIERYSNQKIKTIWSNEEKLKRWQEVELAVIFAREQMGIFPQGIHERIKAILENKPIDVDWWKARDKEINHDLNAFIDERIRHLPPELHQYFHKGMTSYDTEEPAMALALIASFNEVIDLIEPFRIVLLKLTRLYRYTPMLARTHGQEAKLQSFGKRCFTWLSGFQVSVWQLSHAQDHLKFSKLSGAIGNYQGLSPEEEAFALKLLGLKPFRGATQIMPRGIYLPLANALEQLVASLTQIAEDIRLGARSGLPIMQEPFGKKQKGSSAMPHKKNTITCEQQIGMLTMVQKFANMLRERMITWEERAIEQSCVERVAWPDLFHIVMQSFKNMNKVLSGLQVFPDNMMIEIINSRSCYASEDVKDWLKEKVAEYGLQHEDAYRMVQLAAFNCHQVSLFRENIRKRSIPSFDAAAGLYRSLLEHLRHTDDYVTLEEIIRNGKLVPSEELEASAEQVAQWNEILLRIFADEQNQQSFKQLFTIAYQLRNEHILFEELK